MVLFRFVSFLVAPILVALVLVPSLVMALTLQLPSTARQTAERISPFDSYDLPLSGFTDGAIRTDRVEGRVIRRTWRIDGGSATTLQLLVPLRAQLDALGFAAVYECVAFTCGGFDFRFGIEVVPAPDMHVDIEDFRFLSTRHADGRAASLLVSRSRSSAFVQVIVVEPVGTTPSSGPPSVPSSGPSSEPAPALPSDPLDLADTPGSATTDLGKHLLAKGHVILDDLAFASGGSSLEDRAYASLRDLSVFLLNNPELRVVLVGHTDSTGDLTGNIRLSKRRAEAVRARLVSRHGADPARVSAEGNGYLAPIASNLSAAGQKANRRVEAILLPR